ncbi:hypothetical protein EDD63_1426 [Breznakia blatticola]|uniref:Alpha/beta hydrolase domain-containing protein n=1 Tax=Breznakia blatticola TaxID=1754012 RepID=A0A4R7ZCV1_9FIRM|nr:alpha/beta hydrolase domain-containing protein [Breznakia blatticola]TDW13231.1 hypothetical protein EDD63_1426 [Breznakia blatticola]
MIKQIKEIPITNDSYPFASASRYLDLDAYGYVEKEYYIDGLANVYESIGNTGEVRVAYENVAYRNRIIVRAPKEVTKASGNVVIEIINPTSFMEIDRMWILTHEKFMRDGDIYVGITSKPNTIAKMVAFDKKRYESLQWPNPREDVELPFTNEQLLASGLLPDVNIEYEPGLFWDMLSNLAWMLRSDDVQNPIATYPHTYVYLTGWSKSACYVFRYVNSFAYRKEVAKDSQVFDGYLAGGGVRSMVVPVNQYESLYAYDYRLKRVEKVKQPFISIQTESENGWFDAFRTKRQDSDHPNFLYREYEIAGASHDTMFSYVDYYKQDEDLKRIDMLPKYDAKHAYGNNYPSQFAFAAGFKNLFRWVREGVGPASCMHIAMDEQGNNRKDAFGNSIGGLRTCLLDYPTGQYGIASTIEKGKSFLDATATTNPLFGYEQPFPASMLEVLYQDAKQYTALCKEHTKEQVSKGFICKEDEEALINFAVNLAIERGLPICKK